MCCVCMCVLKIFPGCFHTRPAQYVVCCQPPYPQYIYLHQLNCRGMSSCHTSVDQSYQTPLAVAIGAGAFKEVQRLVREGAASSIFVKGSAPNSILCTLPNAVKPDSAVVTHPTMITSVPKDITELVDDGLVQCINTMCRTVAKPATVQDRVALADAQPDLDNCKIESFRVGDLVRLCEGCSISSLVNDQKHGCSVDMSEVSTLCRRKVPTDYISRIAWGMHRGVVWVSLRTHHLNPRDHWNTSFPSGKWYGGGHVNTSVRTSSSPMALALPTRSFLRRHRPLIP